MKRFTILRALGLSLRAWLRNFVPFTLLAAALHAPVFVWLATYDLDSAGTFDELVADLFTWPMFAIVGVSTLLAPLLTYRVVQDLRGVTVSMLTSMRYGVRGFVPALALAVAVNLLTTRIGGIAVAAFVICVYYVAAPAAVAERLGVMAALTRSSELTEGRRWGILGLTLLFGLVVVALVYVWIWPMLTAPGAAGPEDLRAAALVFAGALALVQLLTGLVTAVGYVLLREDKDGLAPEELAQVFE